MFWDSYDYCCYSYYWGAFAGCKNRMQFASPKIERKHNFRNKKVTKHVKTRKGCWL